MIGNGSSARSDCALACGAVLLMFCQPVLGRSAATTVKGPSTAVSQVATRYGFASYKVHGKQIALRGESKTLEMVAGSRRASFNGVAFWLSAAPVRTWGRWTMLQSDVDKMLGALIEPSRAVRGKGYRVVVLDAGHGGEDPGAANARYGIQEKRITLALANATRDILRQRGIDVYVTRTGDRTMGLPERCQYAARVQADVFVSIHLNSAANPDSSGIETHILPPAGHPITASATVGSRDRTAYPGNSHDGANMALGYSLQKSLLKRTGAEDRGVRRSRFWVVRNAPCPAALVECGFVSNGKEARRLLDAEYQGRVARALAEGVLAYLDAVRRTQPVRSSTCCGRGQYDNQT
jgi:N-acetylmuramoyl-L-alanine amidase